MWTPAQWIKAWFRVHLTPPQKRQEAAGWVTTCTFLLLLLRVLRFPLNLSPRTKSHYILMVTHVPRLCPLEALLCRFCLFWRLRLISSRIHGMALRVNVNRPHNTFKKVLNWWWNLFLWKFPQPGRTGDSISMASSFWGLPIGASPIYASLFEALPRGPNCIYDVQLFLVQVNHQGGNDRHPL